jgi:hypothetical protein
MSALQGKPFKEDHQAKMSTLLRKAYGQWGSRWVWAFNIYAIWDNNLGLDKGTHDQCTKAIELASGDYNAILVGSVRERIKMITGHTNDPFWIGETGWSSPKPDGHNLLQGQCPTYCSKDTLKKVYSKFLSWDFALTKDDTEKGYQGPDHAFYFANRDSHNMNMGEYFGMVKNCNETACKLQKEQDRHSELIV